MPFRKKLMYVEKIYPKYAKYLTKEQQNNDYIYFVKKPFVAHIKKNI